MASPFQGVSYTPRRERPCRRAAEQRDGGQLFDDLGHRKTERLRSSQINNKIELDRRLNGEIGHVLALEDASDIRRCSTHRIDVVNAVGQQAAFDSLVTVWIDRRQRVPSRKKNDQLTVHRHESIRHYDQAATRL